MSSTIVQPRLPTVLKDIHLEILDVILQNCYTYIVATEALSSQTKDIAVFLASVNFCWFQRTRRKKFKTHVLKQLSVFYNYIEKRRTIIRNNRNYLLANLQPTDKLLEALQSSQCLTKEDIVKIRKLHKNRDKNAEILQELRPFSAHKYSAFIKGLRQTRQHHTARVLEIGGVVVKVTTQNMDFVRDFVKNLNDVLKKDSCRVHPLNTAISEQDILIDKSSLEIHQQGRGRREQIVVWLWLKAPLLFKCLRKMSNPTDFDPSFDIVNTSLPEGLNVDCEDFKKAFGVRFVALKFTKRLSLEDSDWVRGITRMRHMIFLLCVTSSDQRSAIRIYQDETPFKRIDNIEISDMRNGSDIVSNEAENCLYVSDNDSGIVWKLHGEISKVPHQRSSELMGCRKIRWLTSQTWIGMRGPYTLSISNDGSLVIINVSPEGECISIYTPDVELHKRIKLSPEVNLPKVFHAVQTSSETVLVVRKLSRREREALKPAMESQAEESSVLKKYDYRISTYVVSEFNENGKRSGRQFIPRNEEQNLKDPLYLCLDSNDRVFVADTKKFRLILLDSYLDWRQNIAEVGKRGYQKLSVLQPCRLHFDKERKQLVVAGGKYGDSKFDSKAVVYTLIEK